MTNKQYNSFVKFNDDRLEIFKGWFFKGELSKNEVIEKEIKIKNAKISVNNIRSISVEPAGYQIIFDYEDDSPIYINFKCKSGESRDFAEKHLFNLFKNTSLPIKMASSCSYSYTHIAYKRKLNSNYDK